MSRWPWPCALPCVLAAGCLTSSVSYAPGRGLLRFDAEPPAGAAVWSRPSLRVGDRFTVRRGDVWQTTFAVVAVDEAGYRLDNGGDFLLHLDLAFGRLGEWRRDGVPQRRLRPVDTRCHWPLWVGKTWSCEFADHPTGGVPTWLHADYHVEALDRIRVPAGTFDALRIVRRVRVVEAAGRERAASRAQVLWLDPATGFEVRQLVDGSLIELVEHTRAPE